MNNGERDTDFYFSYEKTTKLKNIVMNTKKAQRWKSSSYPKNWTQSPLFWPLGVD